MDRPIELSKVITPYEIVTPFKHDFYQIKTKEFSGKAEVLPWFTKRSRNNYLRKFIESKPDSNLYKVVYKYDNKRNCRYFGLDKNSKKIRVFIDTKRHAVIKLGGNNDNIK